MAFLDGLSKTLTDMGKDTAQRTKDVVDILQMKAQVGTEKSKLRDLYVTIGESYYEVYKDSAEAERAEVCGQIESSLAKTTELEEKISRLGNTVTYPSCDTVLDKGSAFYSRCGAAVISPSQDLMVAGEDVLDEVNNVMMEDVKEDMKETAGNIVVEEVEKTEE